VAKVVYAMNLSLDGFIKDADGGFDWSVPREDLHRLANEQVRGAAALLYGRRLYETMEAFWTTAEQQGGLSPVELEFARAYVATPRIVFSDTLERVGEGARLVRSRDAVVEVITRLPRGISVGAPSISEMIRGRRRIPPLAIAE